jgi:corrinoid protein of di/trimethylamine methyltransferase
MSKEAILEHLAAAVEYGDGDQAREYAQQVIDTELDPLVAVEQGLSKGMDEIGAQFERGEVFLPELLMAAAAFDDAMGLLQPEIEAQNKKIARIGTVLISTVRGDVHNIGKNIVATVLGINGFHVVDMGVDNTPLDIIQEGQRVKADILALSSLMTTTMPAQKEVLDVLEEMNMRHQFQVMVGGGPVTSEWAAEIGADGYGNSTIQAVETAQRLAGQKNETED